MVVHLVAMLELLMVVQKVLTMVESKENYWAEK